MRLLFLLLLLLPSVEVHPHSDHITEVVNLKVNLPVVEVVYTCSKQETIAYSKKVINDILSDDRYHLLDADVFLAQGVLESGYGKSKLAREGNNWFGHKCYDCDTAIIMNNDHPGDRFRIYPSVRESFEAHARMMVKSYQHRLPANPDTKDWLHALCGCGDSLSTVQSLEFVEEGNHVYANSCFDTASVGYANKLLNLINYLN